MFTTIVAFVVVDCTKNVNNLRNGIDCLKL